MEKKKTDCWKPIGQQRHGLESLSTPIPNQKFSHIALRRQFFQTPTNLNKMNKSCRMVEVTVDLVRMRKSGGKWENRKVEGRIVSGDSFVVANDMSTTNSRRKRKAAKDGDGLRQRMLDLAEKRARVEVLALLGLGEEVADEDRAEVKKEKLCSHQHQHSERGCKIERGKDEHLFMETPDDKDVGDAGDKEEKLLMEMQSIFNDLHDLS